MLRDPRSLVHRGFFRSWLYDAGRTLTARQWWQVAGLTVLLVLLWSIGLWKHWQLTILLAGTIALLGIAVLGLLVERARAARRANELERSLRGQAEDSRFGIRPERREQVEQIEQEFTAAVESLKKSKLGKGRLGQSALYALPWYVIMGPPAAGKTTAITASGLDFPLGTNRIRGIGGTRNCDWFFSTQAIFLDTAGRYAVEAEDREEWFKFLDLLKAHRRRTPVNGVIVMVSIDELLAFNAGELQQAATDLRARIDELTLRLGVRSPVYVVFTKCDLIRGFSEYFADLTPKERDQVWGCTLRSDAEGGVYDQFEREFDVLVQTLVNRRTLRMASAAMPSNASTETYLFPLEFAAIGETVGRFVRQLFQSNPYRDDPFVRGFYFTSALQEGPPTDRVLSAIGQRFDVAGANRPSFRTDTKSSFLASLFRDVIIHDQNRVAPVSRSALAQRHIRRALVASIVVAFVGFGWLTRSAFARSSADILMIQSAVQVTDKPAELDSLRPLENALQALEQPAESHWFGELGLDRSGNVLPALNQLLVRRAVPILRATAFRATEDHLRAYAADSTVDSRTGAYDDLRAYLLLGADVGRLRTSPDDRAFLKEYLRNTVETRPRDSVYTNRFVSQVQSPVMPTDSALVARTRDLLYTPPTVEGIYHGLRDEGTHSLGNVNLARLVGTGSSTVFVPGAQVSGFFTKAGWESFVQGAIENRSREPARANWVLGSKPERLPAELSNSDSLAGRLLALYFRDYAAEWRGFLAKVRYTQSDRAAAIRQLDVLQDIERSPLVALLDSVTAQTRFESPTKKKASDFISSTLKKFGYEGSAETPGAPSNPVDRAFAPIHALRGPALGQILAQYQDAGSKLQAAGDGALSASGAEQLSRELQTARINISRSAKSLDADVRDAVFTQPIDIARAALKNTLGGALISQWRTQVCGPYQNKLADKYPFNRRATTTASILDVERYFRPQSGTMWAFYDRELSDYIRPGDFQAKGSATIPQSIGGTLRRARSLGDGLFDGSGSVHLDFDLVPQPPSVEVLSDPAGAAPTVTQLAITIDGQTSVYQMGRQNPKSFSWPSEKTDERGASIAVTVARVGQPSVTLPAKEARGDWGWLRLIDSASVSPMVGGNVRLDWEVFDPERRFVVHVAYVLHARSGASFFAAPREFFQFECAQ